ncbi:unnamed protein product [Cylicocyclus nassatus]|uniref:Uncharacterized protein n=1 Tax=Cylicocyclus nassatus TaxID=53992 RepID=A0AA36DR01_CYLNA|nr:unnamed protein product [Cylicocyclus nassatus]
MFQERESGEPESWGCLIFIVWAVTIANFIGVMTIRILLDSEDEINEPIIKGELRERLTLFLGIFTMTFFFGCWCCFCCGCMLCKWMIDCPAFCSSLITSASFKFISTHPSLGRRLRKEDEDDIIIDDVVVAARGIPQQKMHRVETDLNAYENPVPFEQFIEPEAITPTSLPTLPPLGRLRSHSIDVSYE